MLPRYRLSRMLSVVWGQVAFLGSPGLYLISASQAARLDGGWEVF